MDAVLCSFVLFSAVVEIMMNGAVSCFVDKNYASVGKLGSLRTILFNIFGLWDKIYKSTPSAGSVGIRQKAVFVAL